MEKKKSSTNGRLYYIEQPFSVNGEDVELFTWEDACEVVRYYQDQHPEERLLVQEFEPI